MRLAKSGAVAGLVFALLCLLDRLLITFSIAASGTHLQVFGASPATQLIGTGAEIAAILFLAWRVWSGRGFVSAILLMALFVISAMAGIGGGLFGLAWTIAYFGLGLMMLNAVRACLRHDTFMTAPARAN